MSYLVENTEYQELLANGDNILQIYVKTGKSKFNPNYGYASLIPALRYSKPNGLKEPARSKLIKWHSDNSNDKFLPRDSQMLLGWRGFVQVWLHDV